jgi:transposase
MPDFKSIADFRKDNGPSIGKVCARFIELRREMKLFTDAVVAIDGQQVQSGEQSRPQLYPAEDQIAPGAPGEVGQAVPG